jgi:uncharacterized Fe-S cluster-containing radical SAM superfamily protein
MVSSKFSSLQKTLKGEDRAIVAPQKLKTVWFNTGTRCNLSCEHCYIESTPTNDRLSYLTLDDVRPFGEEIRNQFKTVRTIGLTGGEPFINPHGMAIIEYFLGLDLEVIVLTNGVKAINRFRERIIELGARYGKQLQIRISFDHYTKEVHEKERGPDSMGPALESLRWLCDHGVNVSLAGRSLTGENTVLALSGYQKMLVDARIDLQLGMGENIVIFPEMDLDKDVPEISEGCWSILGKRPQDQMCATERMVVKRKGEDRPIVLACTLVAYSKDFELGATLEESLKPVYLNHPFCAQFCVLGGASCSSTSTQ